MYDFKKRIQQNKLHSVTIRYPVKMIEQYEEIAKKNSWTVSDMLREAGELWLNGYSNRPDLRQSDFPFK